LDEMIRTQMVGMGGDHMSILEDTRGCIIKKG